MSATANPHEGIGGVFEKVSGPFELTVPAMPGGPMVIETSYIKRYPTEVHPAGAHRVRPLEKCVMDDRRRA